VIIQSDSDLLPRADTSKSIQEEPALCSNVRPGKIDSSWMTHWLNSEPIR